MVLFLYIQKISKELINNIRHYAEKQISINKAGSYWIYENWRTDNKAVIHKASCSHCNNGNGIGVKIHGDSNGKWHGAFSTIAEAYSYSLSLRRPTRTCKHCI
jgi:hypothetical protein